MRRCVRKPVLGLMAALAALVVCGPPAAAQESGRMVLCEEFTSLS